MRNLRDVKSIALHDRNVNSHLTRQIKVFKKVFCHQIPLIVIVYIILCIIFTTISFL